MAEPQAPISAAYADQLRQGAVVTTAADVMRRVANNDNPIRVLDANGAPVSFAAAKQGLPAPEGGVVGTGVDDLTGQPADVSSIFRPLEELPVEGRPVPPIPDIPPMPPTLPTSPADPVAVMPPPPQFQLEPQTEAEAKTAAAGKKRRVKQAPIVEPQQPTKLITFIAGPPLHMEHSLYCFDIQTSQSGENTVLSLMCPITSPRPKPPAGEEIQARLNGSVKTLWSPGIHVDFPGFSISCYFIK